MGPSFILTTTSMFAAEGIERMGRDRYIREIIMPGLTEVARGRSTAFQVPELLGRLITGSERRDDVIFAVDRINGTVDFVFLITDPRIAGLWYSQFELLLANLLPSD